MNSIAKIFAFTLLALVVVIGLYVGYTFSWSVKYKLGDCVTDGKTMYLYDSDTNLRNGKYGMTKLPKKDGEYGYGIPREDIEKDGWRKVECPGH
jgi:hypothetical protein